MCGRGAPAETRRKIRRAVLIRARGKQQAAVSRSAAAPAALFPHTPGRLLKGCVRVSADSPQVEDIVRARGRRRLLELHETGWRGGDEEDSGQQGGGDASAAGGNAGPGGDEGSPAEDGESGGALSSGGDLDSAGVVHGRENWRRMMKSNNNNVRAPPPSPFRIPAASGVWRESRRPQDPGARCSWCFSLQQQRHLLIPEYQKIAHCQRITSCAHANSRACGGCSHSAGAGGELFRRKCRPVERKRDRHCRQRRAVASAPAWRHCAMAPLKGRAARLRSERAGRGRGRLA